MVTSAKENFYDCCPLYLSLGWPMQCLKILTLRKKSSSNAWFQKLTNWISWIVVYDMCRGNYQNFHLSYPVNRQTATYQSYSYNKMKNWYKRTNTNVLSKFLSTIKNVKTYYLPILVRKLDIWSHSSAYHKIKEKVIWMSLKWNTLSSDA